MPDGTLIFDTKLDLTEYKKALASLRTQVNRESGATVQLGVEVDEAKAREVAEKVKGAAESADPTVEIGAETDQGDVNAAVDKVEGLAEKADPKVMVDTEVDTSGVQEDAEDVGKEVQEGLDRYSGLFDEDGNLKIKVELDTSALKRDTREVATELQKQSTGVGSTVKGILGANVIQQAGEKLVDFAKDAVMAASDLQEVQNVVDVTFGESADKINDFAKDGAKAFGLTELQTKRYTGTLGALFKSMGLGQDEVTDMSVAMAGLVGDMASFYNLDYDTAFEKLRSGISGETEPLKQLGINLSEANLEAFALSEGIKTAYQEMTEAEKATLRYNYIMSVTADAQGDFARTSDGFANQLRTFQNNIDTLKTSIGSALLPVLNLALTGVNNLFSSGGGTKTQLQIDIENAQSSLESIESEILNVKNKYANTVLKIKVDYARSQQLLDDYEALAGIEQLTEEQSAEMKAIVDELLILYPELSKIVNKEGLFKKETDQVRELIAQYTELARVKAYTQMVEDIYAQYLKAQLEFATLGEKKSIADQQVEDLQKQYDALSALDRMINSSNLREKWEIDLFSGNMDPERIQKAADAIQAYLDVFGVFDPSVMEELSDAGVDISAFIDEAGNLKEISELDTEGIAALFETLSAIDNSGTLGENIDTISQQLTAAQEAAQTANQGLADGVQTISDAQTKLQATLNGYEKLTGESGSAMIEAIRAEMESGSAMLSTSAGEIGADVAANIADKNEAVARTEEMLGGVNAALKAFTPETISIKVMPKLVGWGVLNTLSSFTGTKHATGLDYVPYNEYPAMLHRGEAVLRADDAAAWRAAQQSGGDTRALDTVAGALEDIASQPINVFIDSEKVAEAVREPISYAQNSASRSRALGVGR